MPVLSFHRRTMLFLSIAVLFHTGNAAAFGLMQAFDAALQNDPAYRAAIHENTAGQQFKVIGRSHLLPNLSFVYTTNQNQQDLTRDTGPASPSRQFVSETEVLSLRQPLFNLDSLARYKQGIAQTNQSDAKFSERNQELIVRIVGAYADTKHAEDQLALAVAQLNMFTEQKQINNRMFEKGEGTKTDMLETQSRYDLAEAQVIEARDNLANMRNVLATISGMEVTTLDSLSDNFRVKPMDPASFDEWKTIALEGNLEIIAQRHTVEIAREEINRQRAGHAPRIDIVASVNRQKSDNPVMVGLDALTRSVGVQVNVPLYNGGNVSAVTSQAVANHEKAKAELDAKINQVLIELRKQYNLALSSVHRIDALTKSVSSANFLVEAMQKSAQRGVRTNLDTLNAQQQLYTAKRDLAQARYNYLLSYLRLRKSAGTVGVGDLQDIASYFVASQ